MDMKLGINRSDLSNAFIRREQEISADSKIKKKRNSAKKPLRKNQAKTAAKVFLKIFTA